MTDAGSSGTEWVPRFGMLEVSPERAALIRGLFELAAFVADHPELPLPAVEARFSAGYDLGPAGPEIYRRGRGMVEQVAAVLGVEAADVLKSGHYSAERAFGPVQVRALAIAPATMAAFHAVQSYSGAVQPEYPAGDVA